MPVGTLVLPDPSTVLFGTGYGANGTELFGTLQVGSGLDLTSLTLTVNDSLDGSHATATVFGAGAGQIVSLFKATWNPQAGGRAAWTQVASVTTDGAGTGSFGSITTTPGYYIWLAIRQPAGTGTPADMISATVFRPVIDPTLTVHMRMLNSVTTLIQSLNLSGIPTASIFTRWLPIYLNGVDEIDSGGKGLPQIQVGPYPREVPMDVMTNRDDVGYPILVGFFDQVNQKLDNNIPRDLKWRRQVGAMFRAQQIPGTPESVLCTWQPEVIADVQGLNQNYLVGGITLMFRSRETRGLVA